LLLLSSPTALLLLFLVSLHLERLLLVDVVGLLVGRGVFGVKYKKKNHGSLGTVFMERISFFMHHRHRHHRHQQLSTYHALVFSLSPSLPSRY
jgi:hypothetical protein